VRSLQLTIFVVFGLTAIAPTSRAETLEKASDIAVTSVGKLLVPGQRYENGYTRHYNESCSGTLVSMDTLAATSTLVISAWHCLEFYHDLSRPVRFKAAGGETRSATLIASGGGMDSDWALLRLDAPLPRPAILSAQADTGGNVSTAAGTNTLMMAGYPRGDSEKPHTLETASGCYATGVDGADVRSNCVLKKGASGGGVFSDREQQQYLGVISRGDGESQSIYVPLARFRDKINLHAVRNRLP